MGAMPPRLKPVATLVHETPMFFDMGGDRGMAIPPPPVAQVLNSEAPCLPPPGIQRTLPFDGSSAIAGAKGLLAASAGRALLR